MSSLADVLSGAPLDPALTGGPSQPISPAGAAAGPMPTPNPPSMPADMAPPDVTDRSINPAVPPPAPPGATGKRPSLWENMLTGALEGMSGASQVRGRGGFGAGAAAGAAAYLNHQQLQTENAMRQQQLQMESARAADSHILALAQAKQSDLASVKLQQEINAQSQAAKVVNDILGLDPPAEITGATPDDMHAKAIGTLPTLAAANGGKIPAVATTNSPAGVGADPNTHTVHAYATTPASLKQNPDGNRSLVNYWRMAQGLPSITDEEWKSGGGAVFTELQKNGLTTGNALLSSVAAGQKSLADSAKAGLYVMPAMSSNPAENLAAAQTLSNRIAVFKMSPNYIPTDRGQQAALALMNQNLNLLQTGGSEVAQKAADLASKQKALETTAAENAKKPFVEAERQFQTQLQTQAKTLDRTNADQNTRALKADTLITTEANNRDSDLSNINALKTNLAQVDAGNQAAMSAFQVKFAEHEIVEGGVKRLNETELNALTKGLGDYGRQFSAWVDKGFKGNMPPATKNDMGAILNAEAQARNNLYASRVGNVNEHILGQKAAPAANPFAQFGGVAH